MFKEVRYFLITLLNKLKIKPIKSAAQNFSYPYKLIDSVDAFPDHVKQLSISEILKFKEVLKIFDFVGNNWLDESKKPIVILWNFNKWKRGFISDYLPEYRTIFISKKFSINWILKRKISKAFDCLPERPQFYIIWGKKKNILIRYLALMSKAKIYYMEDGFLRSFGRGALHVTPQSIVLDKIGIYFDAKHPSDLENILNQPIDNTFIQRADVGIALMRAAKLTKYCNLIDPATQDNFVPFERTDRYSILVIGQVEDDASIIYGTRRRKMTNNDMILEVHRRHPAALIYYRPHPDVINNNRKKYSDIKDVIDVCVILDHKIPLHNVLKSVDHVYTMTSLVGMEALVYEKKVTTLGLPFYAGWGLTDDALTSQRRQRTLSLQELFAGVYLIYPRYYHPASNERIDFIELACYFLIKKVLHTDLVGIPRNIIDLKALKPYKEKLSQPVQLLLHLIDIGINTRLEPNVIESLVKNNFKIRDFQHFSHLLVHSFNYDALAFYINYCLDYLENNLKDVNEKFLKNFFHQLSYLFINHIFDINGRSIRDIPYLVFKIEKNEEVNKELLLNYIQCISFNMQYDLLEDLINLICQNIIDHQFLWNVSLRIQNKTRTERDFSRRNYLLRRIADHYMLALNKCYFDDSHTYLNTILYNIMLNEERNALNAYNTLHTQFKSYKSFSSLTSWKRYEPSKRISCFYKIFSYLLTKGHWEESETMLKFFDNLVSNKTLNTLYLRYYLGKQDPKGFLSIYNNLTKKESSFIANKILYAQFLRTEGELVKSREIYKTIIDRKPDYENSTNTCIELQKLNFVIEASRILNCFPQPKFPKGVIFLATHTDLNSMSMLVPPLLKVKQKGYSVINMTEGMLTNEPTGIHYIDQFSSIIPRRLTRIGSLENAWVIDWPNKVVMADGINFYQGFYESLSITAGHRSYYVDLNIPLLSKKFNHFLKQADIVLSFCKKVFDELISKKLPVVFAAGATQTVFGSIVRDYCRHKNNSLLSIVCTTSAYENYYTNLGTKFSNTVCMIDLTLYPTIRAPFLACRDKFEAWYEQNKDNQKYLEVADKYINLNRTAQMDNSSEDNLVEYLKQQRKIGKRIICAFGKVPVDLSVPYDGGYAHEDIEDWLNHTIKVCGEIENVILLIKPHPYEISPSVVLDIKENFLDLIFEDVKENTKLLGHTDINNHKLAPYIDLAILWNGSSAIELTTLGVPVVMCAYFGKYDYPLDLIYPASRSQYENFLKQGVFKIPDMELQKKAAFLISYLSTDEITLIHQYSLRPVTNDKVGVVKWQKEKIEHFLKYGDPEMDKAADRIIEKCEKNIKQYKKIKFLEKFGI